MPPPNNQVGALWLSHKKTSRGEDYYAGVINGVKVVMFKNTKKTEPKHPDFLIYKQIGQQS